MFQTKAAYVLFYQRRDLSNLAVNLANKANNTKNSSMMVNGKTNHNGMNGNSGTNDPSSEEDMEVEQSDK